MQRPGILRKAWNRWLKFAEIVGTIQMVIVLSLVYWLILMPMAIPFRLLADPLALRRCQRIRWVQRRPTGDILEAMKKQF